MRIVSIINLKFKFKWNHSILPITKYMSGEVNTLSDDENGQLGIYNRSKTYNIPKFCSFGVQIKHISCGDTHTAFITSKRITR